MLVIKSIVSLLLFMNYLVAIGCGASPEGIRSLKSTQICAGKMVCGLLTFVKKAVEATK